MTQRSEEKCWYFNYLLPLVLKRREVGIGLQQNEKGNDAKTGRFGCCYFFSVYCSVFYAKTEDFGVNLGKKEEAVQNREKNEGVRLLKSREMK